MIVQNLVVWLLPYAIWILFERWFWIWYRWTHWQERPLCGCRNEVGYIHNDRCRVMWLKATPIHLQLPTLDWNGNAPRKLMYAGRMPIIHFNDTHACWNNVSLRFDSNKQLQCSRKIGCKALATLGSTLSTQHDWYCKRSSLGLFGSGNDTNYFRKLRKLCWRPLKEQSAASLPQQKHCLRK